MPPTTTNVKSMVQHSKSHAATCCCDLWSIPAVVPTFGDDANQRVIPARLSRRRLRNHAVKIFFKP